MGGKNWSIDEERMLWEVVVPRSVAAANPDHRVMDWEQCAQFMNERAGGIALRKYTKNMLYEHHYQNIIKGGSSPNARPFVDRHLRYVEWYKNHRSPPPGSPPQLPRPLQDPELAAILDEQSKPKKRRTKKAAQIQTVENRTAPTMTNESEAGPTAFGTPNGHNHHSFAPFEGAQQQTLRGNQPLDFRELPRTVRAARPGGNFLGRPMELVEGGHWRVLPQTPEEESFREDMPSTLRASNVEIRQSRAQEENAWTWPSTRPPQWIPQEPHEGLGGTLPSIRQALPFINFRQPTNITSTRETTSRTDKRGYSGDQVQSPAPKRRRLPDHPVRRQGDQ
ncbi:hypothetical protein FBEOM_740 [Fusarium beomiforme]|uniref:Uncharacterized protein n=1 Tax=Fusarium beomiforme TaxID=44412 RepID=A0A9P5E6A4_9HYPO|nr:hypothetical protein FBEOM_740 [Fusarium beomiforme]